MTIAFRKKGRGRSSWFEWEKKKLKDKELIVLSEKENVQEEYFVEFLGEDHEVQQNERIE